MHDNCKRKHRKNAFMIRKIIILLLKMSSCPISEVKFMKYLSSSSDFSGFLVSCFLFLVSQLCFLCSVCGPLFFLPLYCLSFHFRLLIGALVFCCCFCQDSDKINFSNNIRLAATLLIMFVSAFKTVLLRIIFVLADGRYATKRHVIK